MLVNDRRILGEVEVLEVAALDGSWHIDFVLERGAQKSVTVERKDTLDHWIDLRDRP